MSVACGPALTTPSPRVGEPTTAVARPAETATTVVVVTVLTTLQSARGTTQPATPVRAGPPTAATPSGNVTPGPPMATSVSAAVSTLPARAEAEDAPRNPASPTVPGAAAPGSVPGQPTPSGPPPAVAGTNAQPPTTGPPTSPPGAGQTAAPTLTPPAPAPLPTARPAPSPTRPVVPTPTPLPTSPSGAGSGCVSAVQASVKFPQLGGGTQTLYVTTVNAAGQPVAGATGSAHVRYSTTSRDLALSPTDARGSAQVSWSVGGPRGTVTVTVTESAGGCTAAGTTTFQGR
jgi:hypothetical protein